jgi:hypothetical protein
MTMAAHKAKAVAAATRMFLDWNDEMHDLELASEDYRRIRNSIFEIANHIGIVAAIVRMP